MRPFMFHYPMFRGRCCSLPVARCCSVLPLTQETAVGLPLVARSTQSVANRCPVSFRPSTRPCFRKAEWIPMKSSNDPARSLSSPGGAAGRQYPDAAPGSRRVARQVRDRITTGQTGVRFHQPRVPQSYRASHVSVITSDNVLYHVLLGIQVKRSLRNV
jgi:hypothetical protein